MTVYSQSSSHNSQHSHRYPYQNGLNFHGNTQSQDLATNMLVERITYENQRRGVVQQPSSRIQSKPSINGIRNVQKSLTASTLASIDFSNQHNLLDQQYQPVNAHRFHQNNSLNITTVSAQSSTLQNSSKDSQIHSSVSYNQINNQFVPSFPLSSENVHQQPWLNDSFSYYHNQMNATPYSVGIDSQFPQMTNSFAPHNGSIALQPSFHFQPMAISNKTPTSHNGNIMDYAVVGSKRSADVIDYNNDPHLCRRTVAESPLLGNLDSRSNSYNNSLNNRTYRCMDASNGDINNQDTMHFEAESNGRSVDDHQNSHSSLSSAPPFKRQLLNENRVNHQAFGLSHSQLVTNGTCSDRRTISKLVVDHFVSD